MSWHTGQIIARLLAGQDPAYPIHPFTPDRIATET